MTGAQAMEPVQVSLVAVVIVNPTQNVDSAQLAPTPRVPGPAETVALLKYVAFAPMEHESVPVKPKVIGTSDGTADKLGLKVAVPPKLQTVAPELGDAAVAKRPVPSAKRNPTSIVLAFMTRCLLPPCQADHFSIRTFSLDLPKQPGVACYTGVETSLGKTTRAKDSSPRSVDQGWKSSALETAPLCPLAFGSPPATRTLPFESSVAVWRTRANAMFPVAVKVFAAGS